MKIEKNRHVLVQCLRLDATVWSLLLPEVFPQNVRDQIMVSFFLPSLIPLNKSIVLQLDATPAEQNSRLVDQLLKLDDVRYDAFCLCLDQTQQHHIADLLRVTPRQNSQGAILRGIMILTVMAIFELFRMRIVMKIVVV